MLSFLSAEYAFVTWYTSVFGVLEAKGTPVAVRVAEQPGYQYLVTVQTRKAFQVLGVDYLVVACVR